MASRHRVPQAGIVPPLEGGHLDANGSRSSRWPTARRRRNPEQQPSNNLRACGRYTHGGATEHNGVAKYLWFRYANGTRNRRVSVEVHCTKCGTRTY
jgi:hypothetical protein